MSNPFFNYSEDTNTSIHLRVALKCAPKVTPRVSLMCAPTVRPRVALMCAPKVRPRVP